MAENIEDCVKKYAVELFGESFKFRKWQLEAVVSSIENIEDHVKHTILEAPTGSGKSIIAILTAYALFKLYGKKSYILTSDLSLFSQYENDIMRLNSDDFGCIKGKENYMCWKNGCPVSQSSCSLQGLSPMSLHKNKSFSCMHTCQYVHDYHKAVASPITLMTYQLYFIQRNYVEDGIFGGKNKNFPERDLVVCDECHKICDICQAHFAPHISIERPKWMSTLDRYTCNGMPEDARFYLVNQILSCNGNAELIGLVSQYEKYVAHYVGLNESIRNSLAHKPNLSKSDKEALFAGNLARQEHCKFQDMLDFVDETNEVESVVKTVAANDSITLNFVFDNLMLGKYFHSKSNYELFMSATIGDLAEYAKITGIDASNARGCSIPSTFDFSMSPIYFSSSNEMSYEKKRTSINAILENAIRICIANANYRGIIQTGSYENAELLKKHFPKDVLSRCLFYNGSGEKSHALKKFLALGKNTSDNHILVGPTLLEGLDFPDNLCRFQICIKVPFAFLGSEYVRAKKDKVEGWYVYDVLNKICQGIGRGIRHEHDWCKTYILDGCITQLIKQLDEIKSLKGRFRPLKLVDSI